MKPFSYEMFVWHEVETLWCVRKLALDWGTIYILMVQNRLGNVCFILCNHLLWDAPRTALPIQKSQNCGMCRSKGCASLLVLLHTRVCTCNSSLHTLAQKTFAEAYVSLIDWESEALELTILYNNIPSLLPKTKCGHSILCKWKKLLCIQLSCCLCSIYREHSKGSPSTVQVRSVQFWHLFFASKWATQKSMNRENWPPLTDELVEVQDFRKVTDHFRWIYILCLKLIKKNRKITKSNQLDLETLGFWPNMPKISPNTPQNEY